MWGIFNDESADYTEDEAIESDFMSQEDAHRALLARYADDDCHVHIVEEADNEDEDNEDEDNDKDEE